MKVLSSRVDLAIQQLARGPRQGGGAPGMRDKFEPRPTTQKTEASTATHRLHSTPASHSNVMCDSSQEVSAITSKKNVAILHPYPRLLFEVRGKPGKTFNSVISGCVGFKAIGGRRGRIDSPLWIRGAGVAVLQHTCSCPWPVP